MGETLENALAWENDGREVSVLARRPTELLPRHLVEVRYSSGHEHREKVGRIKNHLGSRLAI